LSGAVWCGGCSSSGSAAFSPCCADCSMYIVSDQLAEEQHLLAGCGCSARCFVLDVLQRVVVVGTQSAGRGSLAFQGSAKSRVWSAATCLSPHAISMHCVWYNDSPKQPASAMAGRCCCNCYAGN
jgi:hypothetical protein